MMLSSESKNIIATAAATAASLGASFLLFKSMTRELFPRSIRTYITSSLNKLTSQLTIVIEESQGLTPNLMFAASNLYLSTKISPSTSRIKVYKPPNDQFIIKVDRDQEVVDNYQGIKLRWILQSTIILQPDKNGRMSETELCSFELSFHKKHKDTVLKVYLPYILRKSNEIKEVRLHTIAHYEWKSVVLNHPAVFDSIAMDPFVKNELIEDLDRFVSRKDYYKSVGRAWKRGYLFYGPPGTGKSSLVAAMANYLKFDVYDLDLRQVESNEELRKLLLNSGNRSILVIEDIDCNFGLVNRENYGNDATPDGDKITLSGLLNFIDGLWSSCGDEKIIIFTTNHKERLDPALLRPGRMDVHLEMSYCTFSGFKILASNYLKIEEHALFSSIENLLTKVKATPAEVAGELMKSENADIALSRLVKFLEEKGV